MPWRWRQQFEMRHIYREKIGKHIDVTTMAYNRLMNHIRHMVSRATTGEKLKVDLNQFIEKNYPESFALAGDICKELGKDLNHEFWTMRQATLPYISSRLSVMR